MPVERGQDMLSCTTVKLFTRCVEKQAPAWCVPLCLDQGDLRGDQLSGRKYK